jgi:hypothetical protein
MFQHPSHAHRARTAFGCACGCGTCSGPQSAYGASFKIGGGGSGGTKWEWDTSYYDSCPKYKEKVDAYEKARKKYESIPSFLGIRAGGKSSDVEKYINKMKAAKRDGENARKKCESKEFAVDDSAQPLSIEQVKQQVGLTGAVPTEEGTGLGPLVYVAAAATLAVGGLVVWKVVSRRNAAHAVRGAA